MTLQFSTKLVRIIFACQLQIHHRANLFIFLLLLETRVRSKLWRHNLPLRVMKVDNLDNKCSSLAEPSLNKSLFTLIHLLILLVQLKIWSSKTALDARIDWLSHLIYCNLMSGIKWHGYHKDPIECKNSFVGLLSEPKYSKTIYTIPTTLWKKKVLPFFWPTKWQAWHIFLRLSFLVF